MPLPLSPSRLHAASRLAIVVGLADVCLVVLFASQDIMRRGGSGGPGDWLRAVGMYTVDWTTWSLLVPLVIAVGRTHNLDDAAHRLRNVSVWIGLGLLCCVLQGVVAGTLLRYWKLLGPLPPAMAHASALTFVLGWTFASLGFNLVFFAMLAGAFHATVYYRDLQARRLRQTALEARLARAELTVLRTQLQPHFLFNALHTVSSLMATDVATARSVISALGDLLRASIDHMGRQEVPLRAEMEFVGRYLEIQQARFRQRLTVTLDVAEDTLDAFVPSLVLQPLVENAIRHGIEPFAAGGRIWIHASRERDCLVLSVRDDGSASAPEFTIPRRSESGVGLSNIEGRLAQLYGSAYEFRAARDGTGEFVVQMSFPYHIRAVLPDPGV